MKGYDENFLGADFPIAIPQLNESLIGYAVRDERLRDMMYLDYLHYTLVMNKLTKQLIFAASNINQQKFCDTTRRSWDIDSRIEIDLQLNSSHYSDNEWDRGHMVRHVNNAWGDSKAEAQKGSDATMFYTNSSFQHANLNQDEWLGLENMFRDFSDDSSDMLTVFTGPVHNEYDRSYSRNWHETVRIPSGFFKVLCFINSENQLETRAFVLYQDEEALKDKSGRKRGFNYRNHQVTITELQHLTGLQFDEKLYHTNPLFYNENSSISNNPYVFPERILVEHKEDIISSEDQPRTARILDESEQSVKILAALINPENNEADNEWISFINISTQQVSLDGWVLKDSKNRSITFSDEVIDSGDILKIKLKDYNNSIPLTNKGNSLTLINNDGNIADSRIYTEARVKILGEGRIMVF